MKPTIATRAFCPCPCEGIIEIIGKKWTLCALATVKNRPKVRFNELQSSLPGISPKTLSETLRKLEATGIIHRELFAEIPPRVEYSLTPSGQRLAEAIVPLMTWAEDHPIRLPASISRSLGSRV